MTRTRTDHTALLVVDLQAGTAPYQRTHPVDAVVANVDALARATRNAGGPVVFIRHDPAATPAGATQYGGGPRPAPVAYGSLLLEPADDDTLTRGGWSAFAGTDLDERLRAGGVTAVVVVGQATTFGVESTARAAYDLGYDVVLVEDATNDPDPDAHAARFRSVFPALGVVTQTADLAGPGAA
ncbi:cysteine hydrolase [Curtobacterium sp. VKM Ac-1393]|uniref:cysteine hydrolase n=1 Tax=Curtobacterium sp. VKM Ac-1393 TaxID=2783814 RepID=UPI001889E03E|nr:cysteine hydrolase [Curtobacterium sp. VKM Ac-1393]MBF4605932.1 cysteine hydrolase [Curtobacterium sp. VKM Ac-1393]